MGATLTVGVAADDIKGAVVEPGSADETAAPETAEAELAVVLSGVVTGEPAVTVAAVEAAEVLLDAANDA